MRTFLVITIAIVQCQKVPVYIGSAPSIIRSSLNGNKTAISIPFMYSFTGLMPTGSICVEEVRLAVDRIKALPQLLPDYDLNVEILDETCTIHIGVSKYINEMRHNDVVANRFPLYLGGPCAANLHTGMMMQQFNFTGFTYVSVMPPVFDQAATLYRNYFVFWARLQTTYDGLVDFIEHMNWKRVSMMVDNSEFYNQMQQHVILRFGQRGVNATKVVGLVKIPYVSGVLLESDQIEFSVLELAQSDPRILIIGSSSIARIACWLHRFNMYGPNYVIFLLLFFEILPFDRTRFQPWCTEKMLMEVAQSVIYFGYSNSNELYGPESDDSTGFTGRQLDTYLMSRIDNPQSSLLWFGGRSVCYDHIMIAAHFLTDVEKQLKRDRNESLKDWFTNMEHFKKNGGVIVDYTRRAIMQTRYRGFTGSMEFDPVTKVNVGKINIGLFQVQKQGAVLLKIPIASYERPPRGQGLIMGPGKPIWRTSDGKVPFDNLQTEEIFQQQLSIVSYAIIVAISCLLLALIAGIMAYHVKHRSKTSISRSLPQINSFILGGDVLLQGYILTQAHSTPDQSTLELQCMMSYGFLLPGFILIFFGMFAKLSIASKTRPDSPQNNAIIMKVKKALSVQNSFVGPMLTGSGANIPKPKRSRKVMIWMRLGGIVIMFCLALCLVWFLLFPIKSVKVMRELVMFPNNDYSLAHQYYTFECELQDTGERAFIAAFGVLALAFLLRASFLAYLLHKKRFQYIYDLAVVGDCLYGTIILLLCGAVIAGAVFNSDAFKLKLTIVSLVIGTTGLNLVSIFLPKLF